MGDFHHRGVGVVYNDGVATILKTSHEITETLAVGCGKHSRIELVLARCHEEVVGGNHISAADLFGDG